MKRFLIPGLMLLGVLFAAPAWSHHAAEGIVSDDIWQMIDDLLEAADSPHLNIDFDAIMDSMAVGTAPGGSDNCSGDADCSGRMFLLTSIDVPTEYVEEYMEYIEPVLEVWNRVPSGKTSSGTALIFELEIVDLGDGWTEISLLEPIGTGQPTDSLVPGASGRQK
jgi:hypothetical protein